MVSASNYIIATETEIIVYENKHELFRLLKKDLKGKRHSNAGYTIHYHSGKLWVNYKGLWPKHLEQFLCFDYYTKMDLLQMFVVYACLLFAVIGSTSLITMDEAFSCKQKVVFVTTTFILFIVVILKTDIWMLEKSIKKHFNF